MVTLIIITTNKFTNEITNLQNLYCAFYSHKIRSYIVASSNLPKFAKIQFPYLLSSVDNSIHFVEVLGRVNELASSMAQSPHLEISGCLSGSGGPQLPAKASGAKSSRESIRSEGRVVLKGPRRSGRYVNGFTATFSGC